MCMFLGHKKLHIGPDLVSPVSSLFSKWFCYRFLEIYLQYIEISLLSSVPGSLGGQQLTARVVELSPWVEYEFRVLATNSIGTGEPSKPSQKIRTKDTCMYIVLCLLWSPHPKPPPKKSKSKALIMSPQGQVKLKSKLVWCHFKLNQAKTKLV